MPRMANPSLLHSKLYIFKVLPDLADTSGRPDSGGWFGLTLALAHGLETVALKYLIKSTALENTPWIIVRTFSISKPHSLQPVDT